MKFSQELPILLFLEKDDPKNFTGLQLRAWKANNGTTIFVRAFKHSEVAAKQLWDGRRTLGEVNNLILQALQDWGLIKNIENWDYSVSQANYFRDQDVHEEKDSCIYFAWSVESHLIAKF